MSINDNWIPVWTVFSSTNVIDFSIYKSLTMYNWFLICFLIALSNKCLFTEAEGVIRSWKKNSTEFNMNNTTQTQKILKLNFKHLKLNLLCKIPSWNSRQSTIKAKLKPTALNNSDWMYIDWSMFKLLLSNSVKLENGLADFFFF